MQYNTVPCTTWTKTWCKLHVEFVCCQKLTVPCLINGVLCVKISSFHRQIKKNHCKDNISKAKKD